MNPARTIRARYITNRYKPRGGGADKKAPANKKQHRHGLKESLGFFLCCKKEGRAMRDQKISSALRKSFTEFSPPGVFCCLIGSFFSTGSGYPHIYHRCDNNNRMFGKEIG
jgi:hypothetical protein